MIALIIKGSPADAARELAQRGIVAIESFVSMANGRETLARCSSDELPKVQAWLCEPSMERPFLVGTLLWYKSLDQDDADRASLEAAARHQPQSQDEVLP